jgi:hypothetical protein
MQISSTAHLSVAEGMQIETNFVEDTCVTSNCVIKIDDVATLESMSDGLFLRM